MPEALPVAMAEGPSEPVVLPVGAPVPVEMVLREHRDQSNLLDLYQFLYDAYTGEGGFAPWFGAYTGTKTLTEGTPHEKHTYRWDTVGNSLTASYLSPHQREAATKYHHRWRTAHYTNYVEWLVRIWSGVLTRHPPDRKGYPKEILQWIDRVKYDQWVRRQRVPWGLVNGRQFTLVNAPVGGDSPDIGMIQPTAVMDWLTDRDGLKAIKYRVPHNPTADLLAPQEPVDRIWVVNRAGWYFFEVNEKARRSALIGGSGGIRTASAGGPRETTVEVKGSGLWDGRMRDHLPILEYRRGVEGRSAVYFPAQIVRRLFNVESLIAEVEDFTAHPLLAVQGGDDDDHRSALVGVNVALNVPEGATHMPKFVDYDVGPHGVLMKRADDLVHRLKQLAALTIESSGQGARTGIAKAYEFFLTGATLADFQVDFEEAERGDMEIVARWHGLDGMPEEANVRYSRNFNLIELKNEMAALEAAYELDPGPKGRATIKKRAMKAVAGDLPEDEFKEIADEIDAMEADDREPEADEGQPPREVQAEFDVPEPDVEAVEQ